MSPQEPFFVGLIFNEEGEPVEATRVGEEPFYAIPDGDFRRHVEAREVDRQVIAHIKEQVLGMKEAIVEGVMQMTGSDDPFTRAAIENNIENMDRILDLPPGETELENLRLWLWMNGFRVTVDVHGEVVRVDMGGME